MVPPHAQGRLGVARGCEAEFRNASILGDNRVVFNIAGNKYRLVVKFNYAWHIGYVRFIGTHAQYDSIDAETV